MLLEKLTTFELPLKGMPCGTQQFEYHLGMDFFREMESTDVLSAAVDATVEVKRSGDIYELCITVAGELGIPCDRCLEPMKHEVDCDYELTVKFGDEYNDETDGLLIVPDSDNDLNVASIVYDTVALTIPISHVHEEGECDEATWEALQAHTAHSIADDGDEAHYGRYADDDGANIEGDAANNDEINESNIDPRWAELLKIKDNNLKNK